MIKRLKNTVLLLWDNYPEYSTDEAEFIEKTLIKAGYMVKKVSVNGVCRCSCTNAVTVRSNAGIFVSCKNISLPSIEG